MVILPTPNKIDIKEGFFPIDQHTQLNITQTFNASLFKKRLFEVAGINIEITCGKRSRNQIVLLINENMEEQEYTLKVNEGGIQIEASNNEALNYGLMTLLQIVKSESLLIPYLEIVDRPEIHHRGFYYDVTRGKVPTVQTIKKLIDILSEYKVNELQLYMEHSFKYPNMSEVFRDKDAFSAEDIIELDNYAKSRYIELIPSISTFGHLYELLRSRTYSHLSEKEINYDEPFSFVNRMVHHTLNTTCSESIEVSRHLIESVIPLFSSDKFNICADETFDLGMFRSSKVASEKGIGKLYFDYLTQLIDIVKQNGKTPMFWGDIILKHPEFLDNIPKDSIILNWGYFANETPENTLKIAKTGLKQYVCPSTTGWNRMINWYDNSSQNIRTMIGYAKENNVYGVLNTDWGDYGHINLLGSSLPMIVYAASLSWNSEHASTDSEDDEKISISLFGKENVGLMNLLRRMSRNQIGNWSYINFYMEKNYANKDLIDSYEETMKSLNVEEIKKSIIENRKLQLELLTYSNRIDSWLLNEYLVMNSLMGLSQEAFLYIMHFGMNVEIDKIGRNPERIAEDIEIEMEQYKRVWRYLNRESELNRVTNRFYEIADLLRSYKERI